MGGSKCQELIMGSPIAALSGILAFLFRGGPPKRNDGGSFDWRGGRLRRHMGFANPELCFEHGHQRGPSRPR